MFTFVAKSYQYLSTTALLRFPPAPQATQRIMGKCKLALTAFVAAALTFASCSDDTVAPTVPDTPTDEAFQQLTDASINEFLNFAKTPRLGFHLDKAKAYLKAWADKHNYAFYSDEFDNVWIDVPANSETTANYPKVILQGHTDMVCASKAGETYDYENEVGIPYYDGNLLKGRNINLGADDGIGVGMALAIATSDIPHGPLRLLFTANEDYDMSGAIGLAPEVLDADYMINIDEEETGKISIACLGSNTIEFKKEYTPITPATNTKVLSLNITGLRGGHSGVMIGEHRLSAASVMASVMGSAILPSHANIISLFCGHAVNAIAIEGTLDFAVSADQEEACRSAINTILEQYKAEYPDETTFAYSLNERNTPVTADDMPCPTEVNDDLAALFDQVVQGVIEKDGDLPTKSNNIGEILINDGNLFVYDMFRTYSDDWLDSEKERLLSVGNSLGMTTSVVGFVPTWDTPGVSPLKDMFLKYYKETVPTAFTDKAKGGLECAYFALKKPSLYAVSVGPQLNGAHTIDESVDITTVKPLLKAIVNTLQHISELKK